MAIKAFVKITSTALRADNGKLEAEVQILSGSNAESILVEDLEPDGLLTNMNAAIAAATQAYCEGEWSVSFTTLLDSVRLINPLTLQDVPAS